jgi:hypothetical protein
MKADPQSAGASSMTPVKRSHITPVELHPLLDPRRPAPVIEQGLHDA